MEIDRFSISQEELKKRFRELSFKYHPDTSELKDAQVLFVKLQLSFEILDGKVPFAKSESKKTNEDFFDFTSNYNYSDFFDFASNYNHSHNDNFYNYEKIKKEFEKRFWGEWSKSYDEERKSQYNWQVSPKGTHYLKPNEFSTILIYKNKDEKYCIQIKAKRYGEEVVLNVKRDFFDLEGCKKYVENTLINNLMKEMLAVQKTK